VTEAAARSVPAHPRRRRHAAGRTAAKRALQMSDLPAPRRRPLGSRRCNRYFPSKQHLVFAILEEQPRICAGQKRIRAGAPPPRFASGRRPSICFAASTWTRSFRSSAPWSGHLTQHGRPLSGRPAGADRPPALRDSPCGSVGPMSPQQREIINVIIVRGPTPRVRHWMAGIMTRGRSAVPDPQRVPDARPPGRAGGGRPETCRGRPRPE